MLRFPSSPGTCCVTQLLVFPEVTNLFSSSHNSSMKIDVFLIWSFYRFNDRYRKYQWFFSVLNFCNLIGYWISFNNRSYNEHFISIVSGIIHKKKLYDLAYPYKVSWWKLAWFKVLIFSFDKLSKAFLGFNLLQ